MLWNILLKRTQPWHSSLQLFFSIYFINYIYRETIDYSKHELFGHKDKIRSSGKTEWGARGSPISYMQLQTFYDTKVALTRNL